MKSKEALTLPVQDEVDVAYAALGARKYAKDIGFNSTSQFMISTAVSELARNIYVYAKKGTITLSSLNNGQSSGIQVIADDEGPGIIDIEKALKDEYSTGGTMGVGLPGTKRLMDDFFITTSLGKGTTIRIVKWL
ncbi:MAG: anti-sigma regulatory factor [Paraglaciecola sp.]|nr:anti-sigma regulatory factor [Paraglaciecola sp.]